MAAEDAATFFCAPGDGVFEHSIARRAASYGFMEEIFKQWTFYLAAGVEAGAAIVIGIAAIEAT